MKLRASHAPHSSIFPPRRHKKSPVLNRTLSHNYPAFPTARNSINWQNIPYIVSNAVYIVIIGAIHAATSPPTTTASTTMIIGSKAAISDWTAISTSSS